MKDINYIVATRIKPNTKCGAVTQSQVMAADKLGVRPKSGALRWGLSLPMAGLVTIALGLTMASLIAVEFVPQDKFEPLRAVINPVVVDIDDVAPIEPPEQFEEIEVPPPTPEIGVTEADQVIIALIPTKVVDFDFDLNDLNISRTSSINIDTPYQPLLRIPPIMPSRAQKSGHCNVRFDVSPQGQPFNIVTTYCTEKLFAGPTIKSVEKWKFRPKTEDGQRITVKGVNNKVRYRLNDEQGRIIPE